MNDDYPLIAIQVWVISRLMRLVPTKKKSYAELPTYYLFWVIANGSSFMRDRAVEALYPRLNTLSEREARYLHTITKDFERSDTAGKLNAMGHLHYDAFNRAHEEWRRNFDLENENEVRRALSGTPRQREWAEQQLRDKQGGN